MAKGALLVPETYSDPLIHRRGNKVPVNVDSIEAMTPEKDHKVIGTFVHIEYPGQPNKFSGKYYKGMQYFNQTLIDGERVTIPLSVARFINERWAWSRPSHAQDEKGNQIKVNTPIARGKFIIEEHLK